MPAEKSAGIDERITDVRFIHPGGSSATQGIDLPLALKMASENGGSVEVYLSDYKRWFELAMGPKWRIDTLRAALTSAPARAENEAVDRRRSKGGAPPFASGEEHEEATQDRLEAAIAASDLKRDESAFRERLIVEFRRRLQPWLAQDTELLRTAIDAALPLPSPEPPAGLSEGERERLEAIADLLAANALGPGDLRAEDADFLRDLANKEQA